MLSPRTTAAFLVSYTFIYLFTLHVSNKSPPRLLFSLVPALMIIIIINNCSLAVAA